MSEWQKESVSGEPYSTPILAPHTYGVRGRLLTLYKTQETHLFFVLCVHLNSSQCMFVCFLLVTGETDQIETTRKPTRRKRRKENTRRETTRHKYKDRTVCHHHHHHHRARATLSLPCVCIRVSKVHWYHCYQPEDGAIRHTRIVNKKGKRENRKFKHMHRA